MGRHQMHLLGMFAAVGALAFVAGCNGGDLVDVGGLAPDPATPIATIDPNNPHNGGEDTDPPQVHVNPNDQDGDGIPDGQDNVPCMAFYLKVWNQQVSSASVDLNDVELIAPSEFPTTAVIQRFINPVPGTNVLTIGSKLTGSPEDELHVELWSSGNANDPATLYLHETIVRGGGAPEEPPPVTFLIDVQC